MTGPVMRGRRQGRPVLRGTRRVRRLGEAGGDPGAEVLPSETPRAAFAALKAVKAKLDDYFGRCRLAAFDPRAAALLNRNESEYLAVAART